MPKTVCQSVAWFKRYRTLKSVTVGRSVGRSGRSTWENSHIQRKLARPSASLVITRCVYHQSESPRAPVSPPAVGLTLFRVSSRQQKYDVIHRLSPHIPFPPLLDADWSARFQAGDSSSQPDRRSREQGFLGVIWCTDFESVICFLFISVEIGSLMSWYTQTKNDHFYPKNIILIFDPPKWSVRDK